MATLNKIGLVGLFRKSAAALRKNHLSGLFFIASMNGTDGSFFAARGGDEMEFVCSAIPTCEEWRERVDNQKFCGSFRASSARWPVAHGADFA